MGNVYIGISGWTYPRWRGAFYPLDLRAVDELSFASRQFNSIEINGTFYRLQAPRSFESWREQTPDGFRFAVKGSRFITHMKQLRDVETPLANFFASGVLLLEDRLGPFLWQFSDRMRFDPDRFARFLDLLPRTVAAAARIARRHDARMDGRAAYHFERDRPLRHALEIRHESFLCDEFLEMLRSHDAAFVVSHAASQWPWAGHVTTDFVYVRLHGEEVLYTGAYGADALDEWARRIRRWRSRHDVFVYFDNDAKVHAPFDAFDLADRLDVDWRFVHAE